MYDGSLVKLEVKVGEEKFKINEYDHDVFEEGEEIFINIDKDKVTVIGDKNE